MLNKYVKIMVLDKNDNSLQLFKTIKKKLIAHQHIM